MVIGALFEMVFFGSLLGSCVLAGLGIVYAIACD